MSGTSEGPRAPAGTSPDAVDTPVTERHTAGPAARPPDPVRSAADTAATELRDHRAAFNAATLPMAVVDGRGHVVRAND
ncbi:histidine kinase, partial [Streptomyces sp. SID8455]|nr:histidine kinase [Streptomyces sp. SID8455]